MLDFSDHTRTGIFILTSAADCILSLKKQKNDIFEKKTLKALLNGFPFSQPEMAPLSGFQGEKIC